MNSVLKDYILYLLRNHKKNIIDNYILFIKTNKECDIRDGIRGDEELEVYGKDKVHQYLIGILNYKPFEEVKDLLLKWQEVKLRSSCNLRPVLPEDIVCSYATLNKILLFYLFEYSQNIEVNHQIIQELESIQESIEVLVMETFKEIQKKVYGISLSK